MQYKTLILGLGDVAVTSLLKVKVPELCLNYAGADICINFCIIRQYRAISNIRIAKNIRMAIPNCHGVYCTVSQAGGLRPSG